MRFLRFPDNHPPACASGWESKYCNSLRIWFIFWLLHTYVTWCTPARSTMCVSPHRERQRGRRSHCCGRPWHWSPSRWTAQRSQWPLTFPRWWWANPLPCGHSSTPPEGQPETNRNRQEEIMKGQWVWDGCTFPGLWWKMLKAIQYNSCPTSHYLSQAFTGYFGRIERGGKGNHYYSVSGFDSPPPRPPTEGVQVYLALRFWSHE